MFISVFTVKNKDKIPDDYAIIAERSLIDSLIKKFYYFVYAL